MTSRRLDPLCAAGALACVTAMSACGSSTIDTSGRDASSGARFDCAGMVCSRPGEGCIPGRGCVAGAADDDADGFIVSAGDCNDGAPAVHPGAPETCNGIDDDCNGLVDDGVASVACDAGPPSIDAGSADAGSADAGSTDAGVAVTPPDSSPPPPPEETPVPCPSVASDTTIAWDPGAPAGSGSVRVDVRAPTGYTNVELHVLRTSGAPAPRWLGVTGDGPFTWSWQVEPLRTGTYCLEFAADPGRSVLQRRALDVR